MRKLIVSALVAASAMAASAITVSEAFDKYAALPGAQVSDVPGYEHVKNDKGRLKDDMDWGKVVMLMGVPQTTIDEVNEITAEITDPLVMEKTAQGTNAVKGFRNDIDEETSLGLVVMQSPGGCFIIYAQGGPEVIDKMQIK